MRRNAKAALAVILGAFAAAPAARAEVTVRIDPGQGASFAQQAGIDLPQLESMLKGELEKLFQTYRLSDWLRSFQDAHAFTTRGLGVDYASNLSAVMVGAAANVSLNAEEAFVPDGTRGKPPVGGLSTNATLMAGVNLGFLGARPLTIFGNFWKSRTSYREFDAHLDNWGVHAQLRLLRPDDEETVWSAFLRWGGIAITTGVDHAHMKLVLGQARPLRTSIPVGQVGMDSARVDIDSTGDFVADLETFSVPLEVTTSFRFLYVLTLYGGGGFDWQIGGGSSMTVGLNGRMTGVVPSRMQSFDVGGAQVTASEKAEPSVGRLRALVGLQANLWLVRVFAQLNAVPSDPFIASLAVGARVAW
jgi:opacity protein-like surface antigen